MTLPSPLPRVFKFVGPAHARPSAPFGLAFAEDGDALVISLTASSDLASIAREIPPPSDLAAGTLVVLLPDVAPPRGLRALFSGARPASRAARCGALVARGYSDVGACVDPHTKLDLVWGRSAISDLL